MDILDILDIFGHTLGGTVSTKVNESQGQTPLIDGTDDWSASFEAWDFDLDFDFELLTWDFDLELLTCDFDLELLTWDFQPVEWDWSILGNG